VIVDLVEAPETRLELGLEARRRFETMFSVERMLVTSSRLPRAGAMTEQVDLSIITVTFDSEPLVGTALRSASEAALAAGLSYEIVVVDNASTDASVAAAQSRGRRCG
jgi:hypothetical protein